MIHRLREYVLSLRLEICTSAVRIAEEKALSVSKKLARLRGDEASVLELEVKRRRSKMHIVTPTGGGYGKRSKTIDTLKRVGQRARKYFFTLRLVKYVSYVTAFMQTGAFVLLALIFVALLLPYMLLLGVIYALWGRRRIKRCADALDKDIHGELVVAFTQVGAKKLACGKLSSLGKTMIIIDTASYFSHLGAHRAGEGVYIGGAGLYEYLRKNNYFNTENTVEVII